MTKDISTNPAGRRAWFSHELQLTEKRRRDLQQQLTELTLSLAAAPDPDVEAALSQVERAIEDNDRRAKFLTMAQAGAAKLEGAEARSALAAKHRQHVAQIDKLGAELEQLGEELIEHIEALAPLLDRFDSAAKERQDLARAVLRDADDPRLSSVDAWYRLRRFASLTEGSPVCAALSAAVWRAGLSRIGPQLDGVAVAPPDWTGIWGRDADLPQVMRREMPKMRAVLSDALERAVKSLQVAE